MSSTSSKNTPGNYRLEQNINDNFGTYCTYVNYGVPSQTNFPGNGLLTGRMAPSDLAYNGRDVESFLWGIGSTNLVEARTPTTPQIKQLQSLNIIDRIPIMVPEPLVVKKDQRPYLN